MGGLLTGRRRTFAMSLTGGAVKPEPEISENLTSEADFEAKSRIMKALSPITVTANSGALSALDKGKAEAMKDEG